MAAATTNRDVSLVIRAKDEASRAFESATAALTSLLGINAKVGAGAIDTANDLKSLADLALTIDKAYGKINAAADSSSAAFDRQKTRIEAQEAALAALKAQAESSAQALSKIESDVVDRGLAKDIDGQRAAVALYNSAAMEVERLGREVVKLGGSLEANRAALEGQRSSLQQIGSTAIAAAEAQEQLAKKTATLTQAQADQARAAQVLNTVEASTGVSRDLTELDQLAAQLKAQSDAHDNNIAKLKAEQEATSQLMATQEAQRRAALLLPGDTTTGKSAKDSASVFQAADAEANAQAAAAAKASAAATQEMQDSASRLRDQLDPLGAIQAKLNQQLKEAETLYQAGHLSADEYTASLALLKANADRAAKGLGLSGTNGKSALFGLKPYDIQNLSYQINDVVTQIASGTSISQTLAQQGGQILQIFPKVGSILIKAFTNPAVIAFSATLTTILLALHEVSKQDSLVRDFAGSLAATADGGETTATSLAKSAEAIDRFGVSAKDATAVVKTFLKDGVNPDRIVAFGEAAKDMADVAGIKLPEAAKQIGEAFTGSYESIKKFDQATNFLTASQRDQIKAMFDAGQADQARAMAFDIFAQRQDEGARKMRGEWSDAVRSLSNAWDSFLKLLAGFTVIHGAAHALDTLGGAVTSTLNRLSGNRTLKDVAFDIQQVTSGLDALGDAQKRQGSLQPSQQTLKDSLEHKLDDLKLEQALLKADQNSGVDPKATGTQAALKATEDLKDATDELAAKNRTLDAAQRIAAAEKKAGLDADTKLGEDQFKLASDAQKLDYKRLAIAQARRDEEKKITDEKDAQNRKDQEAIKSFSAKVPAIEASGNAKATNPNSTAVGLGQFTEQTWLALFRQNFPAEAANMGKDAILALRSDAEITKKMIEAYAAQNADVLKKAGLSVTEANLYLAHFLGPDGAVKVIKAAANTPVSALIGQKSINANPKVLGGTKTAGDVRAFADKKVGDSTSAESDVAAELQKIEDTRAKQQSEFNQSIQKENDLRKQGIAAMTAEASLRDSALIAEQKRQFVAGEVLKAQERVDTLNASKKPYEQAIQFTDEQKAAVEALAAAYFDLQHAADLAQAKTNEIQRPVTDLTGLRDSLRGRIDQLRANGDQAGAGALVPQLDDVDTKLRKAIDTATAFYQALNPQTDPLHRTQDQINAIVVGLQSAKTASKEWGTIFNISAKDIANGFASGVTNAVDDFISKLNDGEKSFKALKDAFLDFAADFLKMIAKMILQQLALNLARGILNAVGVPVGTNHTGGLIGRDRTDTRVVSPDWFAGAVRYHTGGIVGLQPGEVPSILKRGEVVDPGDGSVFNKMFGAPKTGQPAAGGDRFRIVNMIDAGDMVQQGLVSGGVGERALLNWIKGNRGTVSGLLGVK